MGKKIDRFILSVAAVCAFYVYFRGAFGNKIISVFLSLACFWLTSKLIGQIRKMILATPWMRRAKIKRCAGASILRLACMSEEDAQELVKNLIKKCYGDEVPMELIQLHPSITLGQDRLFNAWKKHQGKEKLIVCATCKGDAACRMLSSSLRMPRLAFIDSEVLSRMIAEHPEGIYQPGTQIPRRILHFRRMTALLLNRRNIPRCLLFFISMMLMYILSANVWYLAASLFLLFIVLVSLHHKSRPAKLF